MIQTNMFEAGVRLNHRTWGNRCPACKAPAGSPCKGKKERPFETAHGMRTRFSFAGQYLDEGDDEWGLDFPDGRVPT